MIGLAGMPAGRQLTDAIGKGTYMAIVLIVTAAGGSLIKPCIVGTVERTSNPDYRALGFSIYYALVNLGGAIGPLLASEIRSQAGIEWVFVMSAATSALMLFGTLIFFREPGGEAAAAEPRSFGRVFADMLTVFRNGPFVLFLVIFSGYWIMFWQIFYSFPFYVDEVLQFKRFELLETVDAWTIILLSVPLTALAKKMRPMSAMILGFVISSASWLIVGGFQSVAGSIVGLMLFAVGESIQAPRFYDYVGSLAPRQQVGTYMGFAFLPIAIGSFIAGRLGTWLVETYLRESFQPAMMWYLMAAVGFVSTALLYVYDRVRKSSAAS
jgi:dipeptide/tripeptide permease